MRHALPTLAILVCLASLSSCSDDRKPRDYATIRDLCLLADDRDASWISTDGEQPFAVRVIFNGCESYCASIDRASCEAEVRDGVVFVTGTARTLLPTEGDCPAECQVVDAVCDIGDLPDGTHSLEYDGMRLALGSAELQSCD
jgi:hypothetical protein